MSRGGIEDSFSGLGTWFDLQQSVNQGHEELIEFHFVQVSSVVSRGPALSVLSQTERNTHLSSRER